MNNIINELIMLLNSLGGTFCGYAGRMFIQSSVLILVLLVIDYLLRKRVRATFRYWIWMLVFIKLILPPSLSLPTGIGYWYGDTLADVSKSSGRPDVVLSEPAASAIPQQVSNISSDTEIQQLEMPAQTAQIQPQAVSPIEQAGSYLIPLTRQAVLFGLWLIGVVIISILLLQRIMFVRGLVAQSEPAGDDFVEMLNRCRKRIGIGRDIELRLINNIQSPAVCGLFSPVILIPKTLLTKLPHEKLETVLIHELAHLKRGDLWVNCAQTLLQIVYFYNPLVWLANVIVRRIREQAVDEMVLVTLGPQAKTYSNTLIDIAEIAFFKTSLSLRLIGVVESKKALQGRIKHMLTRPIPKKAKLSFSGITAIIITAAILLPMAKAQRKNSEPQEDPLIPGQFIATLPSGATVELVGVCEHPSKGKQWWRPDGSPVTGEDFGDFDYDDAVIPEKNQSLKLLAFKLDEDTLDDFKISWSFNNAHESRFAPHYMSRKREKLSPVQVILAAFPDGNETTDLTLGVATGKWKSVASRTHGQATARTRDSIAQGDIIYDEAREENGITYITATHLLDKRYDCCIIAEDKDGNLHKPVKYGNSGGSMRRCKCEFDIPLEQIKWFNLQARPFRWMKFENISLRPGVISDLQVDVENSVYEVGNKQQKDAAVLPNGVTVELVGLCKDPVKAGQQWWKPNGMGMNEPEYELRGKDSYKYPGFGYLLKFSPNDDINYRTRTNIDYLFMRSGPVTNEGKAIVMWGENQQLTHTLSDKGDIIVDVAAGEWKVDEPGSNSIYDEFTNLPDNKVIVLSGLRANPEKGMMFQTLIEMTTTSIDTDVELECITIDGETHKSWSEDTLTQEGQLIQHTFGFSVSLEDIEKINVKYRKFYKVVFRNVSLRPGVRTDVLVELEQGKTEKGKAISDANQERYFVTLVVGLEKMTFEGQEVTWEQLPKILEKVPNRSKTVFCIAIDSEDITVAQLNQAKGKAEILSRQFGFEYLSYVGVHPFDSKTEEK